MALPLIVLAITGAAIDADSLAAFGIMMASSILLGAVFIAIGYLISALVRERATAAGIAIGVWLAFVVLYDMGLLGLLVVDQGRTISASMLNVLLLANPTDVYRMLNLAGNGGVSAFAGMAGLGNTMTLAPMVLVAALLLWMLVPLSLAAQRLLAEGAMMRLVFLLLTALVLAGCGPKNAGPTPPPFALTAEAIGHYCGMNLLEHNGPKGQIILASGSEPIWFSSARDAFSFTMLPEEAKDIRAVYVSDMARRRAGTIREQPTGSTRIRRSLSSVAPSRAAWVLPKPSRSRIEPPPISLRRHTAASRHVRRGSARLCPWLSARGTRKITRRHAH